MKSKKGRITFWASIVIALLFIGWAIAKYDFHAVGRSLAGANFWWILPAGIIEILLIYLRAIRWRYFLEPIKKTGQYNLCMATFIGFTANATMPARLGEFLRPYLLAKKENISKSAALGTVVIERAIDGLSLVAMIFIVFWFVEVPEEHKALFSMIKSAGYAVVVFYLVVFATLWMLYKRVPAIEKFVALSMKLVPERFRQKIQETIDSFVSGFDCLGHSHHMIVITIWTIFFWAVAGGLNLAFFHAFHLSTVPFIATYFILIAQMVGTMIPAPGFVGPYHAATISVLAFYGITDEVGMSVAITMHATMFITNLIPGLIFLWLENVSLSKMSDTAKEAM